MSAILSLVSTIIAVLALAAVHGMFIALSAAVVPPDLLSAVSTTYRMLAVERVSLIIAAMGWLIGVLYLYSYYGQAKPRRIFFTRFARVSAIELAIAAFSTLVPYVLRLLAVRGV